MSLKQPCIFLAFPLEVQALIFAKVGARPNIGLVKPDDALPPVGGHPDLWALAQTCRYFYAHEFLHKEWLASHRKYIRNYEHCSDWFLGELPSRAVAPIYTDSLTNILLDARGIHSAEDKGGPGVDGKVFRGWFRPCSFILRQKKDQIRELRFEPKYIGINPVHDTRFMRELCVRNPSSLRTLTYRINRRQMDELRSWCTRYVYPEAYCSQCEITKAESNAANNPPNRGQSPDHPPRNPRSDSPPVPQLRFEIETHGADPSSSAGLNAILLEISTQRFNVENLGIENLSPPDRVAVFNFRSVQPMRFLRRLELVHTDFELRYCLEALQGGAQQLEHLTLVECEIRLGTGAASAALPENIREMGRKLSTVKRWKVYAAGIAVRQVRVLKVVECWQEHVEVLRLALTGLQRLVVDEQEVSLDATDKQFRGLDTFQV